MHFFILHFHSSTHVKLSNDETSPPGMFAFPSYSKDGLGVAIHKYFYSKNPQFGIIVNDEGFGIVKPSW